jgi:hypothetical protein
MVNCRIDHLPGPDELCNLSATSTRSAFYINVSLYILTIYFDMTKDYDLNDEIFEHDERSVYLSFCRGNLKSKSLEYQGTTRLYTRLLCHIAASHSPSLAEPRQLYPRQVDLSRD